MELVAALPCPKRRLCVIDEGGVLDTPDPEAREGGNRVPYKIIAISLTIS